LVLGELVSTEGGIVIGRNLEHGTLMKPYELEPSSISPTLFLRVKSHESVYDQRKCEFQALDVMIECFELFEIGPFECLQLRATYFCRTDLSEAASRITDQKGSQEDRCIPGGLS